MPFSISSASKNTSMRWNHVRNNFGKKWLEAENYLAGFNAQKMLHAMNGRQKFPKTCSQKIEANSFQKLAVRPTSSASFLNFAVSTTAFRPIVGEGLRIQNTRARNEHVCQIMCRGGCVNFIQFFLVWTCVCVCGLRHFCCNGEGRALKQIGFLENVVLFCGETLVLTLDKRLFFKYIFLHGFTAKKRRHWSNSWFVTRSLLPEAKTS